MKNILQGIREDKTTSSLKGITPNAPTALFRIVPIFGKGIYIPPMVPCWQQNGGKVYLLKAIPFLATKWGKGVPFNGNTFFSWDTLTRPNLAYAVMVTEGASGQ